MEGDYLVFRVGAAIGFALPGSFCIFWPIPITDSGLIRSPILELCDH